MEFTTRTPGRGVVDLTGEVQHIVSEQGVKDGLCSLFVRHTTAALFVNEDDDKIPQDLFDALERLIPKGAGYRHDAVDGNADAHLKASLLGPGLTIPIVDGKLALGTWQQILLAEFDGPRERNVIVQVLKE